MRWNLFGSNLRTLCGTVALKAAIATGDETLILEAADVVFSMRGRQAPSITAAWPLPAFGQPNWIRA